MSTKALFPCGVGSNLILGTGMANQIFFLRIPATVKFFSQYCQKMTLLHNSAHSASPKFIFLIMNNAN